MNTTRKSTLRSIMQMAWQFVKRNGYSMSEALKVAWLNSKVVASMKRGITQFFFTKVDGSIRQAFGTLAESMLPQGKNSGRKPADSVQVYFDTEKQEYRCYKRCNLIRMA